MDARAPVQLHPEQIADAHDIAEMRERTPRAYKHRTHAGESGYITHLIGIMGELAVAEYYGLELELVFNRSDNGVDFTLEDGKTLQVKAVPYFDDPCMKLQPADTKADFYMLVCVATVNGYCEIVGTTTRREVLRREPARYRPHLPLSRLIYERDLTPPRQKTRMA